MSGGPPNAAIRKQPALPPGIQCFEDARGWGLRRLWRWPWDCFLVLASLMLAMDAGLVFFAAGIGRERKWELLLILVWPALPVLFLSYLLVATLFNRTEVRVGNGRFRVWHGPVPWWGNRTLPLGEVRGLAVRTSAPKKARSGGTRHTLEVRDSRGRKTPLFTGLESLREAEGLKEVIEARLGPLGVRE
jgi:hypothetical protein